MAPKLNAPVSSNPAALSIYGPRSIPVRPVLLRKAPKETSLLFSIVTTDGSYCKSNSNAPTFVISSTIIFMLKVLPIAGSVVIGGSTLTVTAAKAEEKEKTNTQSPSKI